jgi:hypothetical protein
MDALVVVLAMASMYIEYKLIMGFPRIGHFIGSRPYISLGFSLGLSVLLGMFFGAAGLIVMVAGIASTAVMSVLVYPLVRTGQVERMHKGGRQVKQAWDDNWESTQALIAAIASIFQLAFKLIAFVFGVLAFILKMLGKVTTRLNSIGANSTTA